MRECVCVCISYVCVHVKERNVIKCFLIFHLKNIHFNDQSCEELMTNQIFFQQNHAIAGLQSDSRIMLES